MYVINVRTLGDLCGKFPQSNGSSVIDLACASYNLNKHVNFFKILEPVWFSDHCPNQICLNITHSPGPYVQDKTSISFQNFISNKNSKEKFTTFMKSEIIHEKLDAYTKSFFENVDEATDTLSNIIQDVANHCLTKQNISHNSNPRRQKYKGWNEECSIEKKLFKKCKRDLHLDSKNINKKHIYLRQKKKYRKTIYKAHQFYKENKIRSVEDLEYKDPKVFWKIIKDLSQNHMELNTSNLKSNSEWVNYFS